MKNLIKTTLLALVAAGALSGCHRYIDPPGTFAELDDQETYAYRATSAEGVVLAVQEHDNDPAGNLDFWASALDTKLRRRGYSHVKTKDVVSDDGYPGRQLRYKVSHNGRPHAFWVNLYVKSKTVYVVEAGGDEAFFEKREPEIERALKTVNL